MDHHHHHHAVSSPWFPFTEGWTVVWWHVSFPSMDKKYNIVFLYSSYSTGFCKIILYQFSRNSVAQLKLWRAEAGHIKKIKLITCFGNNTLHRIRVMMMMMITMMMLTSDDANDDDDIWWWFLLRCLNI